MFAFELTGGGEAHDAILGKREQMLLLPKSPANVALVDSAKA